MTGAGQSRAVLIGTSRYDHLTPVPAAAANLAGLATLLSGTGGGFTSEQCEIVLNPTLTRLGSAVGRAARAATEVLLMYYTGHGLLDRRGRLHLTVPGSNPDDIRWTTTPFEVLREEVLDSPARVRILILDCCFAGRAFEALADVPGLIAGQTDLRGTYTITSSSANEPSFAPAGNRHTAFTGALLDAATAAPGGTLDTLYEETDRRLHCDGHPRPQRRNINIAGQIRLFGQAESEHALRAYAHLGEVVSMYKLGFLLGEQGELDTAEWWYHKAAAASAGDDSAANQPETLTRGPQEKTISDNSDKHQDRARDDWKDTLTQGAAASVALASDSTGIPVATSPPKPSDPFHLAQISDRSFYAPRLLTDIGWPRQAPDPGALLRRHNGALTVTMQPGVTRDADNNAIVARLPHGLMARQLVIWMCSEAIRTGEAELYPTDPEKGFFATTGVDATSGPDGTIAQLLEQIERIFGTRLTVADKNNRSAHERMLNVLSHIDIKHGSGATPVLDAVPDMRIQLSVDYLDEIVYDPTPIDWRVMTHPWETLLTIDVYLWLAACSRTIHRETRVPWNALWEQFEHASGKASRAELRKFKDEFRDATDHVNSLELPLAIEVSEPGAILSPLGAPAVPHKPGDEDRHRALPFRWDPQISDISNHYTEKGLSPETAVEDTSGSAAEASISELLAERFRKEWEPDTELLTAAGDRPNFSTASRALLRADELGIISKYGVRAPLEFMSATYVRIPHPSEWSPDCIPVHLERRNLDPIVQIEWSAGQSFIDMCTSLAARLRTTPFWEGEGRYAPDQTFSHLSSLLLTGLKAIRNGQNDSVNRIFQIIDNDWTVTESAILGNRNLYEIPLARFQEDDWFRHVTAKPWVNRSNFIEAFNTAEMLIHRGIFAGTLPAGWSQTSLQQF
ncbi:caspase, EACC1-associated type [Nocardia stercoris]|uniref:Peptidase C14 caspase domain-containing protein n=1 Tax=Nocardia stercoris TaxID=2483361 RepID=A0A3M2L5K4_9NOCA|nr:replication protein RepA [Nocardia stercoris]RMI32674.1 hypothetical protein EBN03_11955 [Nocardia stercoris]